MEHMDGRHSSFRSHRYPHYFNHEPLRAQRLLLREHGQLHEYKIWHALINKKVVASNLLPYVRHCWELPWVGDGMAALELGKHQTDKGHPNRERLVLCATHDTLLLVDIERHYGYLPPGTPRLKRVSVSLFMLLQRIRFATPLRHWPSLKSLNQRRVATWQKLYIRFTTRRRWRCIRRLMDYGEWLSGEIESSCRRRRRDQPFKRHSIRWWSVDWIRACRVVDEWQWTNIHSVFEDETAQVLIVRISEWSTKRHLTRDFSYPLHGCVWTNQRHRQRLKIIFEEVNALLPQSLREFDER